jgi:2-polyprenyl-3-methyl-5-hydroxy-6-metoxy-1,4-benzoquinol methylase
MQLVGPPAPTCVDPTATARLAAAIEEHARFSRGAVERGIELFGAWWMSEVDDLLSRLYPDADSLVAAVRGYAAFAMDGMRRQMRFERELVYPQRTYDEARAEVYDNLAYMHREYLPGLLLSHLLWPHHVRMLRFFRSAFVGADGLSRHQFVEVGVGTGIYSRMTLQDTAWTGTGLDISPASLEYAERHIRAFDVSDRYRTAAADVITTDLGVFDRVICVEVLEHLDDPSAMLGALRRTLRPGGRGFITAAVNAANADHIHLYRHPIEVEGQLRDAGFHVEEAFSASAYPPPRPGVPVPVAAAFVVS